MSTSPKKTSATGGKRSSTPRQTKSTRPTETTRPIRREVGAVICLLLALFTLLGYFGVQAIFIDWWCGLLKGLLGYGFWAVVPMLGVATYILALHRGRPVRLRLTCALLTPIFLGGILHLFLCGDKVLLAGPTLQNLWPSGQSLTSGGVISGLLGSELALLFSKIGALILLIVLQALLFLGAFHVTPQDLVDKVKDRPHREYQPPEPVEPPAEGELPKPAKLPKGGRKIDIPMDGEETPKIHVELETKPKKKGFFSQDRAVPTPAEFLTGAASHPPKKEPEPVPEPEPADPFDIPLDPPAATAQPQPQTKAEAKPAKVTSQEAAQAAQEVTTEITASMEQPAPAYQYPPLELLTEGGALGASEALGELKQNQDRLADTIRSFGVDATIVNVVRGPSVTRYEMELDQGVKLSRVTNLADDIALALGAEAVRIAPIPDKISTVGIEVPNKLVSTVHIRDVIGDDNFQNHPSKVSFAVGKDIGGNAIVGNIAKLPHLLIAGTTGSGKSVCTNSLIISLLYKATPEEVRLIMVDPKMVELGIYNGIPHLLIPVVTDPKKAAGALQWAVTEMMKRYRAFAEIGVRDLASYNAKAEKTEGMEKMPQVVVLIDELADLMLVAAKEVEESICRVAQMGRASGMHLVIATQRPSADVITGLMKANIPSRIAFAVSSSLESRIILDTTGAEKLVGKGDMLWFPLGAGKPHRVQGCFVSDEEVAAVVDFVKQSGSAEYDEAVMAEIEQNAQEKEKNSKSAPGNGDGDFTEDQDELLPVAIQVVVEMGQASVSMLQRRLKLGYGRAARLVDQMEEMGVVGPSEGSKPRQVLINKEQWAEMQYRQGITSSAPAEEPTAEPPMDHQEPTESPAGFDDIPPFELDESDDGSF